MTQLELARQGTISPEMERAAAHEGISAEKLRDLITAGQAVIPKNINHAYERVMAVGTGLRTKVNANIGTSGECTSVGGEIAKLQAAVDAGTDSVMDLSTGGDLKGIRREILTQSPVMVGAVPIYAVATELSRRGIALTQMDADGLFRSIEEQCAEGLDYITVHCGVTQEVLSRLEGKPRLLPSVSRGGSILMHWMRHNQQREPALRKFRCHPGDCPQIRCDSEPGGWVSSRHGRGCHRWTAAPGIDSAG